MAFKSKGGFVIRPIVTADSQGGANASIATINSSLATVNSRLTELESKVFPATVVSMDLVKLTDMTFDLTVVFSKTIRQLTSADLELTSCTAANFRRPSDTTQIITLTATSPTQFSYKIKEDSVAGRFVGSSLQTKVANTYRESGRLDYIGGADSDGQYQTELTTIGNPILFGYVRDAGSAGGGSGGGLVIQVGAGPWQFEVALNSWISSSVSANESSNQVLLPYSVVASARRYFISGYTEVYVSGGWRLVALTKVY